MTILNWFYQKTQFFIKLYENNLLAYICSYAAFSFCLIVINGPSRLVVLFFLFLISLFYVYHDISIALFQLYLFSTLVGQPFFINRSVMTLQNFAVHNFPQVYSLLIEIPLRFVLFLFFFISLLLVKGKRRQMKSPSMFFIMGFITICGIVLLMNIAQILGGYQIPYSWFTYHLIEIFMSFLVVSFFLHQRSNEKKDMQYIKNIFFSFILFTLALEGVFAFLQFFRQSTLNVQLEKFFLVSDVRAPENNLFRSAGTFGHPNYLGSIISMFLPLAVFVLSEPKYVNTRKGNLVYFVAIISIFLGVISLILSFSRWSWISLFVGLVILFLFNRKKLFLPIKQIWTRFRKFSLFIPILLITIFSSLLVVFRFQKISTFSVRVDVATTYINIIRHHYLWGVGANMSSIDLSPYGGNIEKYLSSIKGAHNTFLFLTADNGMLVGLLFLTFIFLIFFAFFFYQKKIVKNRSNNFLFFFASSLLIFILNSITYPLYTFDPSLELFFIISSFFFFFLSFPELL